VERQALEGLFAASELSSAAPVAQA
jgi:hypothetical protein